MDECEVAHLSGSETRDCLEEIQQVYGVVFPDYDLDDHRRRTLKQTGSSGFESVTARIDGALIGFVYGLPLPVHSPWWDGLAPARSGEFVTETGKRTFAVIDLALLPANRGQGLGRWLLNELLSSRAEERATLAADPSDAAVQRMYERWGWQKAGRVPGRKGETQPAFDLYVIALRSSPEEISSR